MKTKVLALLLAVCLAVSLLPVSACADDGTGELPQEQTSGNDSGGSENNGTPGETPEEEPSGQDDEETDPEPDGETPEDNGAESGSEEEPSDPEPDGETPEDDGAEPENEEEPADPEQEEEPEVTGNVTISWIVTPVDVRASAEYVWNPDTLKYEATGNSSVSQGDTQGALSVSITNSLGYAVDYSISYADSPVISLTHSHENNAAGSLAAENGRAEYSDTVSVNTQTVAASGISDGMTVSTYTVKITASAS